MYCLIQLYMAVKVELAPQKPLLKLFAIKAVGQSLCSLWCLATFTLPHTARGLVFLTFWQATFLSVLTLFGVVKDVGGPVIIA